MIQYNFKTKEIANIFDSIKYVVNNSCELTIECNEKDAKVVSLFNQLFVGIPVEKLGKLTIGAFNSETTGYFISGYQRIYFSLHNDIMYIRKGS